MKETFKEVSFRIEATRTIGLCNEVIERYLTLGLLMTLRQLYYQLVTRNAIPNKEQEYKRLGHLVSQGRLAGLIDWGAIEDRGRRPQIPSEWNDLTGLVNSALRSYRLPRWADQPAYMELWVEKDALSGVLQPLADRYHVPLIVNKGYSSQSAMKQSAARLRQRAARRPAIILYLGDMIPAAKTWCATCATGSRCSAFSGTRFGRWA